MLRLALPLAICLAAAPLGCDDGGGTSNTTTAGDTTTADTGVNDTTPPASTETGCSDTLTCVGDCPDDDDDACAEACLDNATEQAITLLGAALACVEEKCPEAGNECLEAQCGGEIIACAQD